MLSQNNPLSPEREVPPVKNVTWPVAPEPVNADPPTHVLSTAKHPSFKLIPFENDEVPVPCIDSMPEVSMFPVVVVDLPTPRPPETVSWLVEAWVRTERYVVVADVEVERFVVRRMRVEDAVSEVRSPTRVEVGVR